MQRTAVNVTLLPRNHLTRTFNGVKSSAVVESPVRIAMDLSDKYEKLERECARLQELNSQLQRRAEDRLQAQEELQKYADRVTDLYNSAPCGYHSLDENGVYVEINDTELNWLGLTREEVVGRLRFSDILRPEQRRFFEDKYRQFVAEGSIRDVEYQLIAKDGTMRTVLLSASSSENSEGRFVMSRATLYDITDRRRAEELVERSEEKFARAFRSSPVGLAVTCLNDGRFIEVNQAAASFLGYTPDELIGETTLNLELWQDLDERNRLIGTLNQHGSVRDQEITFRTRQGTEKVCSFSAEPIEIDGQPCVLSVLLDLTERRYIEQALRANEEVLRLFVKHTPAAIAMFDNEMRYLQVSDRFLTDYHLEGQDIIGKWHYDVFPNLPERWKEVHRRILGGAVERKDEDPYFEADGNPGWLQWESRPWHKADGAIGGLILFSLVITERKRAETALRSSEERFAKIFNLSPYRMGIVRVSDGTIIDVNDCWVKETGYSKEETVNRHIYDHDRWLDENTRAWIQQMIAHKKPMHSFETRMTTKSGEERYALASVALVDFDGEDCYLWASNDITERKLVEEEKRDLIHDLGERVKELTALQQTTRTLQDETKSLPELLQEVVRSLPSAWQYPEVTAARIRFGDLEFKTNGFASTPWSQTCEFSAGNVKGELEVAYLKEMPPEAIGPFLREELDLLNSLAEIISSALNRRYAQKALKTSRERLRALSARMQSAREEEGTRIAREIHDELGGALTGLKWELEGIESQLMGANGNSTIVDVRKQIGSMTGLIESTINTVRRISSELRPGVLDDLGLVAAVEWQAQQFQKRTGLQVHWESELDTVEVSRDAATAVFRIFQEVLTNVLRHSQAGNIYVKLLEFPDHLELNVVDDGRGITEDEKQNTGSFGLLGMKERALLVGGDVSITGAAGKGTTVVVTIPLSRESESHAIA